MDAERDKQEAREIVHLERYSSVTLQILMYGEVNKKELEKTLFPNWRHIFVPKQIIISEKKNPWYRRTYRSRAFIYRISVGTRTCVDIDVASARMMTTTRM